MRTQTISRGRCNPVYKPGRCGVYGWVQLSVCIVTREKMYFAIVFNPDGNDIITGPFKTYHKASAVIYRESAKMQGGAI